MCARTCGHALTDLTSVHGCHCSPGAPGQAAACRVSLARALVAVSVPALTCPLCLVPATLRQERLDKERGASEALQRSLERAEQARAELAADLNVTNRKLQGATERIVLMTGKPDRWRCAHDK